MGASRQRAVAMINRSNMSLIVIRMVDDFHGFFKSDANAVFLEVIVFCIRLIRIFPANPAGRVGC